MIYLLGDFNKYKMTQKKFSSREFYFIKTKNFGDGDVDDIVINVVLIVLNVGERISNLVTYFGVRR